ncbi:hypothetical protein ACEPAI_475 [Sanghuangporus weigelae]
MLLGSRTLVFTFLFALTLLIAFVPQADATASPAAVVPAHRRQANRMIRKRQLGIIGVGEDPESSITETATATSSAASGGSVTATDTTSAGTTTTTPLISIPTTSSSTATSTSESTTSTSASSASTSTTSSETTSSSTSSSSSSTVSSSSATQTTSEAIQVTSAPDTAALTSSSSTPGTSTITNTVGAAQESATESAVAQGASRSVSKTTITVLAVIGGSIAAVAIIWTIIRKWKFRPSAGFEDRMQPIDWSPEATQAPSGYGLNRSVSNASHGSFHSGSDHGGLAGPRPYNPNGGLVPDVPAHDFTAGPAHLGGGYADLQRGPSPGPQMSSVARGPSFNRGYEAPCAEFLALFIMYTTGFDH